MLLPTLLSLLFIFRQILTSPIISKRISTNIPLLSTFLSQEPKNEPCAISNLLVKCDLCSVVESFNKEAEAALLNDLEIMRIVEGNKFNKTCIELPDGIWNLRYTTSKWKRGRRGTPRFLLYVNATSNTSFHEIDFLENIDGTLKKTIITMCHVTSHTEDHNSIKSTVKSIDFIRNSSRRLSRHISLGPVFNIPIVPSLAKNFLRRRLPYLCSLSSEFQVIFTDQDLHVQYSADEEYNVYSRLYEAWDPMKGWTLVSTV